jgi:hypothetical protein
MEVPNGGRSIHDRHSYFLQAAGRSRAKEGRKARLKVEDFGNIRRNHNLSHRIWWMGGKSAF